ncbi:hypothetical protein H8959_005857 [Pygathrix nigripes]
MHGHCIFTVLRFRKKLFKNYFHHDASSGDVDELRTCGMKMNKRRLSEKVTEDGTRNPSEKPSQQRSIAFSSNVLVDSAEEGSLTAAAELAAQKREQRLRKFRELHLLRNEARKLNHQEVVEEDKRLKLPANWEAKKARLEWELQEEEKKKECASRGEDYEKVKLLEISAEDAEKWERKKKRKNPDLGFSGLKNETNIAGDVLITMMQDIDYINERNAKFNKKAERFYGKYTAEIKQNLERGTAV